MRLNCFLKAFISIPSPSSLLFFQPNHYTYMMKRKIRVNTTA